jgi:hypothetical protein
VAKRAAPLQKLMRFANTTRGVLSQAIERVVGSMLEVQIVEASKACLPSHEMAETFCLLIRDMLLEV